MSVSLKRYFCTQNEAFAFASGLSQQSYKSGIHHIRIADSDDPEAPFMVEWVEECNIGDRYEIHPPTY